MLKLRDRGSRRKKSAATSSEKKAAPYDALSIQSEEFRLEDYLLPPCSIPQSKETTRAYEIDGKVVYFDVTPTVRNSRTRLTPQIVDKLYVQTIRTGSVARACGLYAYNRSMVQHWLEMGRQYEAALLANEKPNAAHELHYQLYIRLYQAKELKLNEFRATAMRATPNRDWWRNFQTLDRLEPEDFGKKSGTRDSTALAPLPDEAYV